MMSTRVLILSATDGTAGVDFCKSLRLCGKKYHIVASDTNSIRLHHALPYADEHFLLPDINEKGDAEYWSVLLKLIKHTKPDFIYAADTNKELELFSARRDEIDVPYFLPPREAVEIYEDKWLTWQFLQQADIQVPKTVLIKNKADLEHAISEFQQVWLRATTGSGGRGSIPTDNFDFAVNWLNHNNGWGVFTAAECLTKKMATWIGLWKEGELIVCQGRNRLHWDYGHLSPSGVSGITGAQSTTSDSVIHQTALAAIAAIPHKPHGVVSVDFTYDSEGRPNPTEIQASRFYSSIYFLAAAGLNLPDMFIDLGLGRETKEVLKREHPLEDGLVWLKTVGCPEQLTTLQEMEKRREKWSVHFNF